LGRVLAIGGRTRPFPFDKQNTHSLGAVEAGQVGHRFHRQFGFGKQSLGAAQPAGVDLLQDRVSGDLDKSSIECSARYRELAGNVAYRN
jgi:hypothetical protein